MKKQITMILGIILIIQIVSAIEIIAGNNYTFEIETNTLLVWDVVGNSSNMEGFLIYQDNYNITFVVDTRFKPDNFTIILFDNSTKEIIKEIHHYTGGGTRIKYRDRNITIEKEVERIVYINQTIEIEEDIEDEIIEIERKIPTWFWVIIVIVVLICIVWVISEYQLGKKNKEVEVTED